MEQQNQNVLSPKVVILKFIEIKNNVLKYWWVVLLMMAIGGGIGFYVDSTLTKRNKFLAKITFSVSGGGGGQDLGSLGGLLGMQQGGGGDANLFVGENLFHMIKTRPVLEKALFTPVELPYGNGKKELFINYYIDSTFVKKDEWEPYNYPFLNMRIKEGTQMGKITMIEQQMVDNIVGRLRRETEIGVLNTKTSFVELRCKLENEMLAKIWAELLLETMQEHYQDNQTRKSRLMYKTLEKRADSLARMLNSSENQLARVTDLNQMAVDPTAKVQETRIGRKSSFITSLYLETQRSMENLRMSIIKETPLFTVIEPVHLPLEWVLFTRENTKFGIAIGLFLSIIIIILRQTYLDAVREVKTAIKK
jgi:hypothetical protein